MRKSFILTVLLVLSMCVTTFAQYGYGVRTQRQADSYSTSKGVTNQGITQVDSNRFIPQRRQVTNFRGGVQDIQFVSQGQVVRAIAVPVTDFGVDFYYKIERRVDEDRIADKITEGLKEGLREELNFFASKIVQGLRNPDSVIDPVEPEPTPTSPPVPSDGHGAAVEVPNQIRGYLQDSCVTCHNNDSSPKGWNFESLTHQGQAIDALDTWKIWDAVETGRMPKNNPALPITVSNDLLVWARSVSK